MKELLEIIEVSEKKYPNGSCWKHGTGGVYVIEGRTFDFNNELSLVCRRVEAADYDRYIERDIYFSIPEKNWDEQFNSHEDVFSNVDLDIDDDVYLELAKRSHSSGKTLNRFIEDCLAEAIREQKD